MTDHLLSMQNKLMSLQCIVNLTDDTHDVETWYDQIKAWKSLNKIDNKEEFFEFCLLKIQGLGAKKLKELVTVNEENVTVYPTLEQMKSTLFKTYGLEEEPEDIMSKMKMLKLAEKEDLKSFNRKYYRLFSKLPEDAKKFISYQDYANAIENRIDAWQAVSLHGKDSLDKIMALAEKAEVVSDRKKELMRTRRSNPSTSTTTNFNKSLNKLNNTNNISDKQKVNNSTQLSGDSKAKQNKVFTCLFCNEVGHKKYHCPKYIQYERLQYQALLNEKKKQEEEENDQEEDHLNC